MTRDEYRQLAVEMGYEIIENGVFDHTFWTQRGLEKVLLNMKEALHNMQPKKHGKAPAFHDLLKIAGKSRYETYDRPNDRVPDILESWGDQEMGAKHWPDYRVEKDKRGNVIRHGPAPFRNSAERKAYSKLTGLEHKD